MKALFLISHPAHFWMYRYVIQQLELDGHEVVVVIRPKDVLIQLCDNAGLKYIRVKDRPKKWGMFGLAFSLIEKTFEICRIIHQTHPDILVASDGVIAWAGRLFGIPAFESSEDDAEAISLYARLYYPFYTGIMSPNCCSAWRWSSKKIGYPSYHELGYLHPNQFVPLREKVEMYGIDVDKPYILIRFAQLTAHHDVGVHGINLQIAARLVEILKPHGQIYITSERPLEPEFEPYRIKINPLDMHHVMAFASLYIGDSQTMAAEAGVLGTPFVRFNDFVGRLGYLDELEEPQVKQYVDYLHLDHHYNLGVGIRASEEGSEERLYATVEQMVTLTSEERKRIYSARREKMLSEKIDYAKFLTWFIENYPESVKQSKQADSTFWERFK